MFLYHDECMFRFFGLSYFGLLLVFLRPAKTKVVWFIGAISAGLLVIGCFFLHIIHIELELELIQTQMTQKPMLRAEGEYACVAQMVRSKIKERGGPSALR